MALCLIQQEKWIEAVHYSKKAIKINKHESKYWQALANAEYQLGNQNSAIDAYEEAVALDPEEVSLFLDWSFIYYESGDLEVAINILKEGMEDNPDAGELYYRMTS